MTAHDRGATRILLWVMSTLTVLVLLFGYRTSLAGPDVASGTVAVIAGSADTTPDTTSDTTPDTTTDTTARTVTGPATPTRFGPVQVELSVTGSGADVMITDVAVLQYPHSDGKDAQINGYALPILVQDTLDQQSADVDMVSGATYTSVGYQTSLQAAIDLAQA